MLLDSGFSASYLFASNLSGNPTQFNFQCLFTHGKDQRSMATWQVIIDDVVSGIFLLANASLLPVISKHNSRALLVLYNLIDFY